MLLKFGSEKNIRSLQAGNFYMKNLQYYIDLEKTSDDESVGDKYEGQMVLQDVKINIFTVDTHEFIAQLSAPVSSIGLGYQNIPVFCMYMLDDRNITSIKQIGEDDIEIKYSFSAEQSEKMRDFGDTVLLIENGNEFVRRISEAAKKENVGFTRDFVKYHDGNSLEQLKEVQSNNLRAAFWKRQKYAYQQEYRYAFHTEAEDFMQLDIGDISDISRIMKTKELLNMELCLHAKGHYSENHEE